MKILNRMNLPEPLVNAVSAKEERFFTDNEISATELLKPPQMILLERKYRDVITADASEMIWALLGDSIHEILRRANETGLAELRLRAVFEKYTLSGKFDHFSYRTGELTDWKVASAWSYKGHAAGEKIEWAEQLNLYAYLLRMNGHEIKTARIVALLRDWSKLEAARDPEYPQFQVAILPVVLDSQEYTKKKIADLLRRFDEEKRNGPKPCSERDRWAKKDSWAVVKDGAERALRVLYSQKEAQDMTATKPGTHVEFRPGESVRCKHYCSVRDFCPQWAKDPTNPALLVKSGE